MTGIGVAEIRRLASRLVDEGWHPDCVFSSPFRRARETAQALLAATSVHHVIAYLAELEPEHDPADLERALAGHIEGADHILLVTHVPLVNRLARRWCNSDEPISTGHLLEIQFDGAPGKGLGKLVESIEP